MLILRCYVKVAEALTRYVTDLSDHAMLQVHDRAHPTLLCQTSCQVRKEEVGRMADNETLQSRILNVIHLECQCAHCCSHHAISVTNQLNGFSVQGKGAIAVEEKLYCAAVQLQTDALE